MTLQASLQETTRRFFGSVLSLAIGFAVAFGGEGLLSSTDAMDPTVSWQFMARLAFAALATTVAILGFRVAFQPSDGTPNEQNPIREGEVRLSSHARAFGAILATLLFLLVPDGVEFFWEGSATRSVLRSIPMVVFTGYGSYVAAIGRWRIA